MGYRTRRAERQGFAMLVKFLLIVLVLCWPLAIRPLWLGIVIEVVWIVGPVAALAFYVFRKPKKVAAKG